MLDLPRKAHLCLGDERTLEASLVTVEFLALPCLAAHVVPSLKEQTEEEEEEEEENSAGQVPRSQEF